MIFGKFWFFLINVDELYELGVGICFNFEEFMPFDEFCVLKWIIDFINLVACEDLFMNYDAIESDFM